MSKLSEDFPAPPFEGFKPAAFKFFHGLKQHQDKTWFTANKAIYETEVQAPLGALVQALAGRLSSKGLAFNADPKRAMFRINRDVRFSADKAPYKTHAGAAMTRSGEKNAPGVLYIHIEPARSFIAAGFFRPESDVLHRLRMAIARSSAAWVKVEKSLAAKGLELVRDDVLVKPPKGFEPVDPAVEHALKLKSWIVRLDISQAVLQGPEAVTVISDFALAAAPLLKFGWAALDDG